MSRFLDLGKTLFDYHLIAINYHWTEEYIKSIPISKREMWVEYIKSYLEQMHKSMSI